MRIHSRLRKARRALDVRSVLVGTLVLLLGVLVGLSPARSQYETLSARELERLCGVQVVSSEVIERAIRAEARRDYDITATPNQGRFTAALLFSLAERRRKRRPDDGPFLIRHQDLYHAFLRVTGLSPDEVPPTYRKADEVGLVMVVEYRKDRVIETVEQGPEPRQALAVRATWPSSEDLPSSYAYEDTTSDPDVQVRRQQHTTYRLLEYADFVLYDEMKGIAAQPTSGALGALFKTFGMVDVRETRYAVANNGAHVSLTSVDVLFSMETTATVSAEGRAQRGIPEGHPELERLSEVLQQDLEMVYAGAPPHVCPDEPDWSSRAER